MTTPSTRLDECTTEQFTRLNSLDELASQNTRALKERGYETKEDVAQLIADEINTSRQ